MSDLPEGVDLDTDEGFSAFLAAQVGGEAPAEEPAAQEESVPEGQPRDEQGRFAEAVAEPAEVPEEGAASPVAQEETADDPWASVPEQLRAEHERVKREAAEAQSLIGRQGNELGTVRQEIEALKSRLDTPATPPPVPGTSNPDVEQVEAFVAEHGGQAAINWVVNNRPDLIDATVEAWALEDPIAATRFAATMATFEAQQQYQPPAQPAAPDLDANFQKGIATVKAERSDWDAIKPHLSSALEEAPDIIKNNVMNEDAATQLEAIRGLAEIARYRALATATGQAIDSRQAQATAAKQAATVVSGSLQPAQERKPEGPEAEKANAVKAFQDRIMAAGVTSVLDAIE